MLALALIFATTQSLLAHALPGTNLTLSHTEATVSLQITVNVEDLIIAEPALADLQEMSLGPVDAPDMTNALSDYFSTHMRFAQGSAPLLFELASVALITDRNDHVGTYRALVLTFSAQTNAPLFPLTLRYDAVMHEVRNHRVAVFWQTTNGATKLAEFGFRRVDGDPQAIELTAPPK